MRRRRSAVSSSNRSRKHSPCWRPSRGGRTQREDGDRGDQVLQDADGDVSYVAGGVAELRRDRRCLALQRPRDVVLVVRCWNWGFSFAHCLKSAMYPGTFDPRCSASRTIGGTTWRTRNTKTPKVMT